MTYWQYLVATPLSWTVLSGFFVGASLSRVSRPIVLPPRHRREKSVDRLRSRKWVLFFLGLTAACLLALAAVFVPRPQLIVDHRIPWAFGSCVLVSFLMFRFKRAFGAPMLIILLVCATFLAFALSPWTVIAGETEILGFRVLSTSEPPARIEIVVPDGLSPEQSFRQVDAIAIQPEADVLLFDPLYFFIGGKCAYRDVRLNSELSVTSAPAGGNGIAGLASRLFLSYLRYMPGIRRVRARTNSVEPFPLKTYTVRLVPDGTLSLAANAR